jgi:peptidyl-prolyl cis-trans isomerase B (cyclophilin B)
MDVVDKIVAVPRDEFDNPLEPIVMQITVKE